MNRDQNQRRIEVILSRIKNFLNLNYLTVNESKTVLIEIMMKQKRARIPGSPPQLTVITPQNTTKVITAGKSTLLLGATLQDNLNLAITSGNRKKMH